MHQDAEFVGSAVVRRLRFTMVAAALTMAALSSLKAQAPVKGTKKPKAAAVAPAPAAADGKRIFATTCAACHQASGEGLGEQYPPLAGSEWVTDDEAKMVRIILHGLTGPVDVAGQGFSGAMPAWGAILKDQDIAAVATYVRSAWGNKSAPVSAASVKTIRSATLARTTPWTVAELAMVKPAK